MKKLILVILAAITTQSCDVPVKEVENPSQLTTLEVIENIKPDTVQMSVVRDNVYILEKGKVKYRLINEGLFMEQIDIAYLIFLHLLVFIGVVALAIVIFES